MANSFTLEDYDLMVDPSGYSRVMLKSDPYPWQARVMDSLNPLARDLPARTALCTPNESGKTSKIITDLVCWHMGTFPGSVTVTTSGTNRQIRHQLYPNLRMRLKGANWRIRDSNEYGLEAPNGSRCVSFSTDDPGMAEGFHAITLFDDKYTLGDAFNGIEHDYDPGKNSSLMIIYDEAKTIDYDIFEAFERCHATRSLEASTPDHSSPAGHFYDSFHKNKWLYNTFTIGYDQCPHLIEDPVRVREREDQIRKFGINHPFIRSMHFGEFPTKGGNMVFDMRKVDICMSDQVKQYNSHERRAAVDLSGGGDECPLYIRDGNKARFIGSWYEADAVELANILIAQFKKCELKPEFIMADNTGMGDPIIDVMSAKGWPICRIDFGSEPRDKRKYANVRAEMYFELSHLIGNTAVILPDDPDLKEQLNCQKYRMNDKEQTRLIPKDKLPVSPDRADTIAMLFYDMPSPQDQSSKNSLYDSFDDRTLSLMVKNPDRYEEMFTGSDEGMLF